MYCVWSYNHGGPLGPMKRSDDGGLSWSPLLDVPENWSETRNCPTIYRLRNPSGENRTVAFAGEGPDGSMYQAVTEVEDATCDLTKSNHLGDSVKERKSVVEVKRV